MRWSSCFETPLGPFEVQGEGACIVRSSWVFPSGRCPQKPLSGEAPSTLLQAIGQQLEAYFQRSASSFDLPFLIPETRKSFLLRLLKIPSAQTTTYGELSRELGAHPRAIATWCRTNPLGVFFPCHRVASASGLGGYQGKAGQSEEARHYFLEVKAKLLRWESQS